MSDQQDGMEHMEALWRGQKGEKGDRGEKGISRLPAVQGRAIIYLFVLCIALFVVLGLGLFHQQRVFEQRMSQLDAQQSRIRCKSIAQIIAIPIPAPIAGNPSRQWEATYEHVQRRRGLADGCKLAPLTTTKN